MGPIMGRSILSSGPARACWRHSRGIQRRPAGGDHWSRAHVQRPLTQVYEQGPLPACIPARSNFYLASCHTSTWISTGCGTLDTCFGEQSSYTRPHNACIPSLSHAGKACHKVLPHPAGLVRMYFATAPLQALSRPCRLRARRVRGYKPRLRFGSSPRAQAGVYCPGGMVGKGRWREVVARPRAAASAWRAAARRRAWRGWRVGRVG